MDGIKHSGRFAEMERLVNDYFNCHIAPKATEGGEIRVDGVPVSGGFDHFAG